MKKLIFGHTEDYQTHADDISQGAKLVDLDTPAGRGIAADLGIDEKTIVEISDTGCKATNSKGIEFLDEDKCNIIKKALN